MSNKNSLKKNLGLLDSTSIVMGSMIGSGIFIVSCDIARSMGSSGWFLLAWILTGLITLTAALSYGELAAMMPEAGGMYVYLREAFGKLIAFLYGWSLFTVIQCGTIAAVSIAFAKFTGYIFPVISSSNWIYKFGDLGNYHIGFNTENSLAIISIIFLTWINTKGISFGKFIQNLFTVIKVFAIILLIIIGFSFGKNLSVINQNLHDLWKASSLIVQNGEVVFTHNLTGISIYTTLGAAMVGSIFSSVAWDTVTYIASEVKNPKKDIPLSLVIGTGLVTLIYILVNLVYLSVIPLKGQIDGEDILLRGIQFAKDDRIGIAACEAILGNSGAFIMAILIMVSTFGCNNGLILSTARVYYAMAKDNLFFKKAEVLNKNQVPEFALIIQGVWSCILCISGTYSDLLDYVVFTVLLFYILSIVSIFVLRKKKPNLERPYKAFGYPFTPALYIIFASLVSINLLICKPLYTWPGLIIVLIGIPVYFIWNKKPKET